MLAARHHEQPEAITGALGDTAVHRRLGLDRDTVREISAQVDEELAHLRAALGD